MRQYRYTEIHDFEFDDEPKAPRLYGTSPESRGIPRRGTIKVIKEQGFKDPLVICTVFGPLLTTKGVPFKDGQDYLLDAPWLEKRMREAVYADPEVWEVKNRWMENGGLPA